MHKVLYCFFFVLIASLIATISFDVDAKGKKLTPKQMHKELNITLELLRDQHPNFGFYSHQTVVNQSFNKAKREITSPLSREEFFKRLMPLVTQVSDAHTCLDVPEKLLRRYFKLNTKVLPIVLTVHPRHAVVTKSYPVLKAGAKITSIDGRSIRRIIKDLSAFTCRDGNNQSAILDQLNDGFPWFYHLAYGESSRHELVVDLPNGSLETLQVKSKRLASILPRFARRDRQSKKFLKTKWFNAIRTYYIDLNSFMPDKTRFQKSIGKTFKDVAKKEAKHLILDLRGNDGGLTENAAHLLSYLVKKSFYFPRFYHLPKEKLLLPTKTKNVVPSPKGKDTHINVANELISKVNRWMGMTTAIPGGNVLPNNSTGRQKSPFKGKIHVLIDGGTASASSMLAAHLRTHGEATFYGADAGGIPGRNCAAPSHAYVLPHSRFELHVAWFCHLEKVTKKFSTFKPDVLFVDSKADSFKKDRLLDLVKGKIEIDSYPAIPKAKPLSLQFKQSYGSRKRIELKKQPEPSEEMLEMDFGIPLPKPKPLSRQFRKSYGVNAGKQS